MTSAETSELRVNIHTGLTQVRRELVEARRIKGHPLWRIESLILLVHQLILLKLADALFQGAERIEQRPRPNVGFAFDPFLPKGESDALVGDLNERFMDLRTKHDHHRAVMWYWNQVARSLAALIGAAMSRKIQQLSHPHERR